MDAIEAGRVGKAIREWLAHSPESQRGLSERIGVSPPKFRQLRDGEPGDYRPDTLVKISIGLWGEPDTIDRIARGERAPSPRQGRVRSLAGRKGEATRESTRALEDLIDLIVERIEAVEGRVAALEDPAPQLAEAAESGDASGARAAPERRRPEPEALE